MKEGVCDLEGDKFTLHLAAQVAVTTSFDRPVDDFEINARGTLNVLEALRLCNPRAPMVFASTNKVYGRMADLAVTETGQRYSYRDLPAGVSEGRSLDFYSPYGCSKGAGDQYVVDFARIYGLRTVVFRQSCIYGPHQFGIEDQGWLAWFAIRALLDRGVTIFGDGKQVRDVLFIEDLIAVYDAAVARIERASGQAYNIGGGPVHTLSLLELVDLLEARLGRRLRYRFADWRPGDQKVFVSDVRKAERELGWSPRVGAGDGLDRMLQWLQENAALLPAVAGRA